MSENSSTAAPATSEIVEELLRQLVDARFVLTDRDGAVTRWSRPAEELFGWPGARMLGRQLPETLAMAETPPRDGGILRTTVRRRNGDELEVTLTLVPVGMSQSLEFNGFLEALEIAAPRGNALQQLQQSHRTVVDWIHAALRGEAHLEDDDLAAGTIVAFRPLVEPPPRPVVLDEDEELFAEPEPAPLEPPPFDVSRVDALEELSAQLGTELRARDARLEELAGARLEEQRALEARLAEADAKLEALEHALGDERERADEAGSALAELGRELADLRSAPAAAAEHAPGAEALERLAARAEQAAEAAESHCSRAGEAAEGVEHGAERALAALRAQLEAAQAVAGEAEQRVERQVARVEESSKAVESGAERVRDDVERLAEIAAAAERESERAREAAEAAQEAAAAARAAAEDAEHSVDAQRQQAPNPGRRSSATVQTNGNGSGGAGDRRPLFAKPDEGPARPPRQGFDDAAEPMAVIALDGHFKELNPAFSDLVGYSEADFGAAVWPPVMDRANLQKHRDQMKAMLDGTTESAEVKTGYVHAQGLLVPVVGTIALVRENGEPSHFLLRAAGR